MKRLAGLSVLAVLTVALAIAVPAEEGAKTNPYFPLKTGAEWTYEVQGGPIKVKVTGTEKIGNTMGYKLETTANNKVSATEVVADTADGVLRYSVNQMSAEPPIMFLPNNPDATKEWNVDSKVAGQEIKGTFKIDKEKVTVPAGTYDNAIHVKGADMTIGNTKTTVEYWFAKNVGIVKLQFTLGTQEAKLELKSYTPGK